MTVQQQIKGSTDLEACDKRMIKASDGVTALSRSQQLHINARMRKCAAGPQVLEVHARGGHHGHSERPNSILTCAASAGINYLLMFGLCCAYGMILFGMPGGAVHQALGVKMNLSTAFLIGLCLAFFSKVPVAIGGPDLNPVYFLGTIAASISESLMEELAIPMSDSQGSQGNQGGHRRLGSSEGALEFCEGSHLKQYFEDCEEYHAQLRATTIFAVAIMSAVLGCIYFFVGRFRLSKCVSYLPTSVAEAFLSCIGYKVFYYAIKYCNNNPLQFIPAACIGVPLYFMKSMHIGNPAIVIPAMLLVPLAVFYGGIFALGKSVGDCRESGLFFPEMEEVEFYLIWTDSLFAAEKIKFGALASAAPNVIMMILVCSLDCLLKISATETKLPVKVNKDYEAKLYGASNVLTFAAGSSVGYMQLKFNVINFGVMGNSVDRRGGILYALLCGFSFFGPIGHFNYMPRFFLSTMLFFAGAGFVAENLWGSRKYLSLKEWTHIVIILGIFILRSSLIEAVVVGLVVTAADFLLRYAAISAVTRKPMPGAQAVATTKYHRDELAQLILEHICDSWLVVVQLKGFIFFASAQAVTANLRTQLEAHATEDSRQYRRLRFVIMECKALDGMDASASKAFRKLAADARAVGVRILWVNTTPEFLIKLRTQEVVQSEKDCFPFFTDAVHFVESVALGYLRNLQQRWDLLHPAIRTYRKLLQEQKEYEPFSRILIGDGSRGGHWTFCTKQRLKAYETVLWGPGQDGAGLFLMHSGSVGIFKNLPLEDLDVDETPEPPIAIYSHASFLNREFLSNVPTRHYAVALEDGWLLHWSDHDWHRMSRKCPNMVAELQQAVLRQWEGEEEKLIRGMSEDNTVRIHPCIDPPLEVRRQINSMRMAEILESLGFYDSVSTSGWILPALPENVVEHLDSVFRLFSVLNGDARYLPWARVGDALKYSGIFRTTLSDIHLEQSLTRDEFQAISHNAIFARLSAEQQNKANELFDKYATLGIMQHHDVVCFFKEVFGTFVRESDVEAIIAFFDSDGDGEIDRSEFLGMLSRLVKTNEQEWQLIGAIRELANKVGDVATMVKDTVVTSDAIVANSQGRLNLGKADELLWAAGWRRLQSNDATGLELTELIGAALLCLDPPGGEPAPSPPGESVTEQQMLLMTSDRAASDEHPATASTPSVIDMRDFPVASMKSETLLTEASALAAHDDGTDRDSVLEELLALREKPEEPTLQTPRAKLHRFLDVPESSDAANMWSTFMGAMIVVSIMTLFVKPLTDPYVSEEDLSQVWQWLELYFTMLFTVEFALRLGVANALGTQTVCAFLRTPANVCDILAVLPWYIEAGLGSSSSELRLFRIARLTRLVRFLRLARLMRLSKLAARSAVAGPVAMVLTVIWGIYLKEET